MLTRSLYVRPACTYSAPYALRLYALRSTPNSGSAVKAILEITVCADSVHTGCRTRDCPLFPLEPDRNFIGTSLEPRRTFSDR